MAKKITMARKKAESDTSKAPAENMKKQVQTEGKIEKVEEKIGDVKEEVREAVKETVSAWRRIFRKKVLLTTAAFIILIILIWFAFRLHATISEDLVITLTPSSSALILQHGEEGSTSFSLTTNNYLFCKASCSLLLQDESRSKPYFEEKGIILADTSKNFSFSFPAKEKGEGQELYTLHVKCQNRKRFLCARSGEQHLASALISVKYTLTKEEQEKKALLEKSLPHFLSMAHDLDLITQEGFAYAKELRPNGESIDGLGIAAAEERKKGEIFMTKAIKASEEWADEEYFSIDVPEMNSSLSEAKSMNEKLVAYVEAQQRLVDVLNSIDTEETGKILRTFNVAGDRHLEREGVSTYTTLQGINPRENASTQESMALNATKKLESLKENANKLLLREEAIASKLLNRSAQLSSTFDETWRNVESSCAEMKGALSNLTLNETSSEQLTFIKRCSLRNKSYGLEQLNTFNKVTLTPLINISSSIPLEVAEHLPICCYRKECNPCGEPGRNPVLFLHGHSMSERNAPEYSLEAFAKIQERLDDEGLYIDGGTLTPFDATEPFPQGEWGKQKLPVSVRATYYYDSYLQGGSYILSVAKSESIDTYAIRVKELVDTLRERTGSDQVTIVAHSMGGLVARRYMQLFGQEDVQQLIMIGTPNQGVEASVATICPWIGADKECTELRNGSAMLAKLNDPNKALTLPMKIIYGTGCDMDGKSGDGVVTAENAQLRMIASTEVKGSCPSVGALHTDLLDPEKYPRVYDRIKELLVVQNDS